MTVAELIAALKAFPPEMEVMVDGYEGGCDKPELPEKVRIRRNAWEDVWYYGRHEEVCEIDTPYDDEAVLISR